MTEWYHLSVWLHIVCSAFWIGGMLFLPLVLLPGIKNNPERSQLLMSTGLKFRFYGWIALAILVVTGLLNIHLRGITFSWMFFSDSNYGKLVSLKIILFLLIILISMIHDFLFGKKAIEQIRKGESTGLSMIARWSGRVLLLISLVMAYLGVIISRGG